MKPNRNARNRAAPQRLLTRRHLEPLGKFAHRVGKMIYGADWQDTITLDLIASLPQPSRIRVGSEEEMALLVHDQIIDALRSAHITAVVHVNAKMQDFAPLPSTDQEAPPTYRSPLAKALHRYDDSVAEEDQKPRQRTLKIKPEVWTHQKLPRINWTGSTATIECDDLQEVKVNGGVRAHPRELYDLPLTLDHAELGVQWPDEALSATFSTKIPNAAWFERYKIYRKDTRLEVLAAAWRSLAFQLASGNALPSAERLSVAMRDYLSSQGNKVSDGRDSGLNEIASRVLAQLKAREEGSVLVSSNPRNIV